MTPGLERIHVAGPKARIRVMFVLPSLTRAGAEAQTISLINGLDSQVFDKYLFVFEDQLDLLDQLDHSNVVFVQVKRRYKLDILPARELARILEREKIDVVHCSLQIALFVGWLAVRLSGHKSRLTLALHTTKNRNLKNEWFDRFFYRWMMKDCDVVVCVCKAQRDAWVKKFPFLKSRIHVVYNGVDTGRFSRCAMGYLHKGLRASLGIPDDAYVVASIAAFRPEKGHSILLAAFQKLRENVPHAHLLLAGSGPLQSAIQETAGMLGLTPFVHFLGSQVDVRPVLAASDVSVIASTAVETFSMAMLESLAMEVPMAASDIGGTREAVRPGLSGILVQSGDVSGMARALCDLANDPDKRQLMGRSGRQIVEREFTVSKMLRETAELISLASKAGSV